MNVRPVLFVVVLLAACRQKDWETEAYVARRRCETMFAPYRKALEDAAAQAESRACEGTGREPFWDPLWPDPDVPQPFECCRVDRDGSARSGCVKVAIPSCRVWRVERFCRDYSYDLGRALAAIQTLLRECAVSVTAVP